MTLLEQAEDTLKTQPWGLRHAFHDAFVAAARETPERQAAWSRALEEAFADARGALVTGLTDKMDRREVEGASQAWREESDPFSVWGRWAPEVYFDRSYIWHWGAVLTRVQPVEGLRALETLPYPALINEVLVLQCREDRELIEELIVASPPVFDEQGDWGPERSVAALLVVNLIAAHMNALHDALSRATRTSGNKREQPGADATLKGFEERELPNWITRVFGLLLRRSDGLRIALGYLGYLVRTTLLGREQQYGSTERWGAHESTLGGLVKVLRDAGVSVAQVREAWCAAEELAMHKETEDAKRNRVHPRSSGRRGEREGEGARTLRANGFPLLCGAAVMLGGDPTSDAEILLFWSWFEELLQGRDPGLSLVIQGRSLMEVLQHFGFLLAKLPDPGALVRVAYAKLEPQRRRARFAFYYDERCHDLESVILLRVALSAASYWLDREKPGEQADAARSLFMWIYERARALWLTAVLDSGQSTRELVTSCFAWVPLLFGESRGEAFKQIIPPLANDACMLVDACVNVRLNGIEAEKLRVLVADAGADLDAALRDVYQWSELTGRKEEVSEGLQKLAEELGIKFNAPEDG
ncbi:hypothetical protein [Chondromyces apiculatus]|uniref:hypothetical protein n=1 Tax=Chondromyces apiculatus TaxID=51 RepID=UPI0005C578B2|nr:hypothetical protein [Chondromyces apiculatus]